MGALVRIIAMVIARIKGMGFLEWAGIASLVDTIITYDVKQQAFQIIVDEFAKHSGLYLDKDDPFSDASISNAVSQKIGVTIRSVKDRDMVREDVENYAAQLVSSRIGYTIHSVTDINVLKADVLQIGGALLAERVGIPVGVLPGEGEDFSPEEIKERVLTWAKAELMEKVSGEIGFRIDEIIGAGNLEEVAADINSRLADIGSVENVTARQIALQVATRMATGAIADFGRVAKGMSKKSRRQLQIRDAQARFRARHGNRQKYVPLGMVAQIN